MGPPGSRVMAVGLVILIAAVNGISFGDYGLLFGFLGVLLGTNLILFSDRFAFGLFGAFSAFGSRSLAVVGLVMASFAVTAATGEAELELCFSMFALFVPGICLIIIGVINE